MYPETRMTRSRRNPALARLSRETYLNINDLILPIFIIEGQKQKEQIPSMPSVFRYSIDLAVEKIKNINSKAILLFGVVGDEKKDNNASFAIDEKGLMPQAVKQIKKARPDIAVITDVCLCAYTDHGHCGLVDKNGKIENDKSLELLSKMALIHAKAGADMVAPSAMMDGQVHAIRKALDENGFEDTAIMSYAAKFASAFYGPFRDAANSSPKLGTRESYQISPANSREAMKDALLDEKEGVDWLMVKPALPYLDILKELKQNTRLPVAAYQVSGEYSMIKLASQQGILDEQKTATETVLSIKRAGADAIIAYYAEELIQWLGL